MRLSQHMRHQLYQGLYGRALPIILGLMLWAVTGYTQTPAYQVISPGNLELGKPLPQPQDDILLTIRGRIGVTTTDHTVAFDRAGLEKIGLIRFTTPTAWTDAPVTFEGVLVSRLLELLAVPADAKEAEMTALNNYQVTIPLTDLRQWPVMIALKRDGNYMSVRDKGPLWVVYPRHAFPELQQTQYNAKWIWQLKEMAIR